MVLINEDNNSNKPFALYYKLLKAILTENILKVFDREHDKCKILKYSLVLLKSYKLWKHVSVYKWI